MFFLNVLGYIDRNDLGIDLYFGGKNEQEELLEKLSSMKLGVYVGELNIYGRDARSRFRSDIRALLQGKQYDCIHVNSGFSWFNLIAIEEAKKQGIGKRLVHSHSSHLPAKSKLKQVYKALLTDKIDRLASECIACSTEAGVWMFGQAHFDQNGLILNNGIDAERYIFSPEIRAAMRNEYDLKDNHIILHVGAFNSAKNQRFLVETFAFVRQKDPLAKLILIGTGEFYEDVRQQVKTAGLEADVIFVGASNRVSDYMHMADLFVLPSVFEGLGIVNIEAQATGLRCLVSDVVPQAAKVTDLIEYLPLSEGPAYWADAALKRLDGYPREDMSEAIVRSGYDARATAEKLQEIYVR